MAGRGSSKWQTERARREKAAAKRERREQRQATPDPTTVDESAPEAETEAGTEMPESQVLAELAALHAAFEDGEMQFEEFETTKERLVEQLRLE